LLSQATLRAASRALFSAGSKIEIKSAMMPITTNNSTSVKPRAARERWTDNFDLRLMTAAST
jgi:hypothetical protein